MNQFVESLKRLYVGKMIDENKVVELFKNKKITEDEKAYILDK
nr:MAG TPA: hypothetical protein [Caudoviricetes sp.]